MGLLHRVGAAQGCRAAWLVACALAALVPGCASFHHHDVPAEALRDRILPPANFQPPGATRPAELQFEKIDRPPARLGLDDTEPERPTGAALGDSILGCSLTLEEAIDLAFRTSPKLEVMAERISQAQAGRTVAFADFLPQATAFYRPIIGDPNYTVPTIPTYVGNVAVPSAADRFGMAELNVQWILCDFGRTTGRYHQAVTQMEIARLQYERARQTVAFDVTVAYFQVLEARALGAVAAEAVRRAESVLRDARNLLNRGTGIRNDVLRSDVLLAQMRLNQVKARTAEGIAVAALNQAMGINVSAPTQVVDRTREAAFRLDLAESLQLAADNREEFGVVLRSIRSELFGTHIAKADFLPKVYVGGVGLHLDGNDLKSVNLAAAGLNIEMPLFQGGRSIGKLQSAESEMRAAVAHGKEICDQIAFEVQNAYLLIDDARQRIALARTAVAGATENLRVVRGLFEKGDATPTDVVDGELALTRAQQDYYTALYDYQTALARLAFAVGLPVLSDFE